MNFAKTARFGKVLLFPFILFVRKTNYLPFIPPKHVKWHVINVFAHHYLQCKTFLCEEQFTQVTKCRESFNSGSSCIVSLTLQCSRVGSGTVIQQQERTCTSTRTQRSSAKASQGNRFVLTTARYFFLLLLHSRWVTVILLQFSIVTPSLSLP